MASSIVVLAFLTVMGLIFGFTNYRGVKKKRKHFEELHKRLKNGQNVVTSSGIYGKLLRVGEETVDLEVKSGAVMTVSRFVISEIVPKKGEKETTAAK